MSVAGSVTGKRPSAINKKNKLKVRAPKEFDEIKGNLNVFLLQCDLYMYIRKEDFVLQNRILFICSYLRGSAYKWVQPHLNDYLANEKSDQNKYTKVLFKGLADFKDELRKIYGNVDKKHIAERKLQALRQTHSASVYAAEFRKLASQVQWEDAGLRVQFYSGLKDNIKDDLVRTGRPDELEKIIT